MSVYDFIMEQIGYTGTALSAAQIELVVLCACVFLVFIFAILAVYFLIEVFKWIIGRCK